MRQKAKKILVTGGAGFIGRHLVKILNDKGAKVRVLDIARKPREFTCNTEYIRGSVLNRELVRSVISDADQVYHLAALPALWSADKNQFYKINLQGTKIVLEESQDAGVEKIIYTSTAAILKSYKNRSHELISEKSKMPELEEMPGDYSRSKWLAHNEAETAAKKGAPVVIVYPSAPVGPGDINNTPPTRMISDFLHRRLPAYMDCWMNLISVEEVALGHLLAAQNGAPGEGYILANKNLKLGQFLKIIGDDTGIPVPKFKIPYAASFASAYLLEFIANRVTNKTPMASIEGVRIAGMKMKFDNSKARSLLGLPSYSVDEAVISCARWLQKKNGQVNSNSFYF